MVHNHLEDGVHCYWGVALSSWEMLHICVLLPLKLVAVLFDLTKVWYSPLKVLPLREIASLAAALVCRLRKASLVPLPLPLPFLVMLLKTLLQLVDSMESTEKELPFIAGMLSVLAVCNNTNNNNAFQLMMS